MRRIGMAMALGVLLSGCTSTVDGSPTPAATPAAARTALAAALGRVPAAALGVDGYFEFGDSARLRELATSDAAWKFQVNSGIARLGDYATSTGSVIGVDLSATRMALTVGQAPQSMIILVGGQDGPTITAAAIRSGWTGGDVLSKDLDLSKGPATTAGISLVAPKIRPLGADVVLSQQKGDPTAVAAAGAVAGSPADQVPAARAALACLGDVLAAAGTGINAADPGGSTTVGADIRTDGGASTVICLGAADPRAADTLAAAVRTAVASGQSRASRQPYRELLQSAQVDVVPGSPAMVRIRANTADPGLGLKMLLQRDIPGR